MELLFSLIMINAFRFFNNSVSSLGNVNGTQRKVSDKEIYPHKEDTLKLNRNTRTRDPAFKQQYHPSSNQTLAQNSTFHLNTFSHSTLGTWI